MFQQAAIFVGALTGAIVVSQALGATKEHVMGKRKRHDEDDGTVPYCIQPGHEGAIFDSPTGCKHCRQRPIKRPRYVAPLPQPSSEIPRSSFFVQRSHHFPQNLMNQSAAQDIRDRVSIYQRVPNMNTGRAARIDAQYIWRKAQERKKLAEKRQLDYEEAFARGQYAEQIRRKGTKLALDLRGVR